MITCDVRIKYPSTPSRDTEMPLPGVPRVGEVVEDSDTGESWIVEQVIYFTGKERPFVVVTA